MADFKFKPFEQMTQADYKKIGFRSGLEIHQQLLTEKKLFCRCPAGKYSDHFDAEILRHMRPTLSELGEYDGTALMEFKTKKEIIYQIKRETVCTYEMDDTPPFLINEEALDISIKLGLLFDSSIVDELHIARKQYLDGSIPTGFQRTAIFALDGKALYNDRQIDIVQMSIEEDSCREVSDIGHRRVYLTDRLGMPLIETVTAPQMYTPQEVADVANICAKLVRSANLVRRGAGAARQDVNVSVTGGTRIEIKGVSKIGRIPKLTYNEAMRQWNLLRLRDELHERGITKDSFISTQHDVTRLLRFAHFQPLKEAIKGGLRVKAVVLKGFAGLLRWQTQTDTYFAKEISDRVRVIACLTTIPNIIHSDSLSDTLTSSDWMRLRKATDAEESDSIVIVWGNERDSDTAMKEIAIRASEAAIGIPSETRQALRDGTNGFERILPGADRMYPDTDLPPKEIMHERVELLAKDLPEKFWEREKRYRALKIPPDTIEQLSVSKFARLFDKAVNEWRIDPVFAAVVLIQFPKRIKRCGLDPSIISVDMAEGIFESFKNGLISKDGVYPILKKSVEKGKFYSEMLPKPLSKSELEEKIKEIVEASDYQKIDKNENVEKVLMGKIMDKLKILIDGKTAAKFLNKIL